MSTLVITRAGPLATIQDHGRPGHLVHGVAASGPMDRRAFSAAEEAAGVPCGAGIEFTASGIAFRYQGQGVVMGLAGGAFVATRNGAPLNWPGSVSLADGDLIDIRAGAWGNYGYVRFSSEIDVPVIMGSRSSNVTVGFGGFEGRALKAGDVLPLNTASKTLLSKTSAVQRDTIHVPTDVDVASRYLIRFVWGIHAEVFSPDLRTTFSGAPFIISRRMDRMGVRLDDPLGVFRGKSILTLVSDPVVPGDIQILGDGTPIVLMRDHQPTGGYPRIGTIIDADIDRFAQVRTGKEIIFQSVTVKHAHDISRASG